VVKQFKKNIIGLFDNEDEDTTLHDHLYSLSALTCSLQYVKLLMGYGVVHRMAQSSLFVY
jgi:hypothetical protein